MLLIRWLRVLAFVATGGEGERGRPALPAELTREIRQFIQENPDMAETNLSGFCTTACKWYLARLRREKFIKMATAHQVPKEIIEVLRLTDD